MTLITVKSATGRGNLDKGLAFVKEDGAMVITHNILAMNNSRQQKILNSDMTKSTEKLSSGYQINRAADNAAGLSISEKMRKQIRGLNRASQNVEEGISYAQTADGALNEVHDMLQRINELAVQAANGTNSETDRKAIDAEVQHLKTEMNRIFETTKFNEKQIWEETIGFTPYVVGTKQVKAVKVTTSSRQDINITNDNYAVIPYAYHNSYGLYTIHADQAGLSISWTGYNGKDYETNKIGWDELREKNYCFHIADYFNDTDLIKNGTGVFDYAVSFDVDPNATNADIINAINGTTMQSYVNAYMSSNYKDTNSTKFSISNVKLWYEAAFASREYANVGNSETGYDFNGNNDHFIESKTSAGSGNLTNIPGNNTSDIATARTTDDSWEFSYDMDGIGEVKAKVSGISYHSNMSGYVVVPDRYVKVASNLTEYYGIFWSWSSYYESSTHRIYYRPSYIDRPTAGTLAGVMNSLTGSKSDTTPGLLTEVNQGDNPYGGTIEIDFSLESDQAYSYGKNTSKSVGGFTMSIPVNKTDTEQDVLDRINEALNSKTDLDFFATDVNSNSIVNRVYNSAARDVFITVPKYEYEEYLHKMDVSIQAGTTVQSPDKIRMIYDCLRTKYLGLAGTNVLTEESATHAIDEVKDALQIISEQRSKFGAYQNRLEHAYNIDTNTEENTQYAESQIRDTNMNSEVVKHTNISVLQQAAQSMLTHANQSNDGVMSLLAG